MLVISLSTPPPAEGTTHPCHTRMDAVTLLEDEGLSIKFSSKPIKGDRLPVLSSFFAFPAQPASSLYIHVGTVAPDLPLLLLSPAFAALFVDDDDA